MNSFYGLIAIFLSTNTGSLVVWGLEDEANVRSFLKSPPEGSIFEKYMGQCGVANECRESTDVGCIEGGEDYVRGGVPVPRYTYPWMVFLNVTTDLGHPSFCTGSLISTRHVLAAGHCFFGVQGITNLTFGLRVKPNSGQVFAVLGAVRRNLQSLNFAYKAKQEVIEIKIPPDTVTEHDIALARIKDVEFSEYIRPICLPFDGIPQTNHYTFAGWGATDGGVGLYQTYANPLQEIRGLHVDSVNQQWPLSPSIAFFKQRKQNKIKETWAHNGTKVLASFWINSTDGFTCKGDSGGPLMWRNPATDRYFLMGVLVLTWNDVLIFTKVSPCNLLNQKGWNAPMFTKVSYFLDYIYREMMPDGYANALCRPAVCESNTTYIVKDGILNAPCDYVEDQGTKGAYCLKGDPDRAAEKRYKSKSTSTHKWLTEWFAKCERCPNRKINWNYQQWINEITLGSFTQPRYYGEESPYDAFAVSYFKDEYDDYFPPPKHNEKVEIKGEIKCLASKPSVMISPWEVCDGIKNCPNAWDENPSFCIGKCDSNTKHEQTHMIWGDTALYRQSDVQTCYENCTKKDSCTLYLWALFGNGRGGCKLLENVKEENLVNRPSKQLIFRGPKKCPDFKLSAPANFDLECKQYPIHPNRNGVFRIQDYDGHWVQGITSNMGIQVVPIEYKHLMVNGSAPPDAEHTGNLGEWVFKYHGAPTLEDSFVTIMAGWKKPFGHFSKPVFMTVKYRDDAQANLFYLPKLPDFHDAKDGLEQRIHLQHLYNITKNTSHLMDTAMYTKRVNPKTNKEEIFLISPTTGKGDVPELVADGPKSYPPGHERARFRIWECTDLLPLQHRAYATPPGPQKKAASFLDNCMSYNDTYTDRDLHFDYGVPMARIRPLTENKRIHLVGEICKNLLESDHIWDYAARMRLDSKDFRRMYRNLENLIPHQGQKSSLIMNQLKPFFLNNTP